jgi:type I restriction enzyme S subunit
VKGQLTIRLGDAVDLINGDRGTNYPDRNAQMPSGHCLFLNTKNVRQGFFDFSEVAFIEKERHLKLGGGVLEHNDIVLTIRGTLGNTAVYKDAIPFEIVRINSAMLIVRPKPPFDAEYIERFLRSPQFLEWVGLNRRGSAQPHLRAVDIAATPIPLIKIDQQRRVVAKLDALLSRLARARAELDRISILTMHFRTQTVRSAYRGELTAAWRAKNRDQLAVGNSGPDLPADWRWTTLGELAQIKSGVTLGKRRAAEVTLVHVPYLRVANVQRGGLNLAVIKQVAVTTAEAEALYLRAGDILLNEGEDRDKLGRGWVWSGEIDNCIHQNHVFRARLIENDHSPKYISFYANEFGQDYFLEHGTQTTNLASISKAKLSAFPVPFAPPKEQAEIVRLLERAFARVDRLEAEAARARALLDRLEAAILGKAFRGELVPQDPNDEPASALLERMRAQRAETPAAKPKRRARA